MADRQSAICFFFRLLVFYISKGEKKLTHFMLIIVCVHFVLQLICVSAFFKTSIAIIQYFGVSHLNGPSEDMPHTVLRLCILWTKLRCEIRFGISSRKSLRKISPQHDTAFIDIGTWRITQMLAIWCVCLCQVEDFDIVDLCRARFKSEDGKMKRNGIPM